MRFMTWLQQHMAAILVTLFIGVVVLAGWRVIFQQHKTNTLQVGSRQFSLQVADTSQAREQGLSGRSSLPANQGVLFVFDSSATQCFWMRDMNFPLDIIWLSAGKQVVHTEQHVSPGTYPQSFCPDSPAKYVIELNAGTLVQTGIQTGQTLNF